MALKKFYRVNQYIRAPKLRIIGEDGKQIGILTLLEAIAKAKEKKVDLVEIAPLAQPPVAKIIDFKKFCYLEDKKERKAKKGIHGGQIKGIRLTPFIAQSDFDFRVKKAKKFITKGNKVRAVIRFSGRQLGKKDFGYNLANKFINAVSDVSQPEGQPKWLGKDLIFVLTPSKLKKNEEKNENPSVDKPPV